MQVILLERIGKLGTMGDEVTVKDGYARNFLLPSGKALRANDANRAKFEAQRATLETRNEERKTEAEGISSKLDGKQLVMIRSAGETGQLYGSVSTRDIAADLADDGFSIAKNQIELANPIKTIGLHAVTITLHPEVIQSIEVNVARSADEAERQAAGEDLTGRDYDDFDDEDGAEEEAPAVEELFEEGVEAEVLESDDAAEEGAPGNETMGDEATADEEDRG
ncbi:MAG: 50S ribosomal protein L9 [Pseudomonadota bacterium]